MKTRLSKALSFSLVVLATALAAGSEQYGSAQSRSYDWNLPHESFTQTSFSRRNVPQQLTLTSSSQRNVPLQSFAQTSSSHRNLPQQLAQASSSHRNLPQQLAQASSSQQDSAKQSVAPVKDAGYVQRTEQAGDVIRKARALPRTNVKEAAALYEHGTAFDPNGNSAMLHNNLGTILQALGDIDRAGAEYAKALTFDPNLIMAKHNLTIFQINKFSRDAKQLKLAGKYDEAIALYQQALRLDTTQAMSHNNLGTAYQSKGDLDAALTEYAEALKIDPNMELATINVGRTNLSEGNFDEAKKYFRRYLQLYPNGPSAIEAQRSLTCYDQDQAELRNDRNTPDYLASATARSYVRWAPDHGPIKVYIAPGEGVLSYQPQFRNLLIESFNDWASAAHNRFQYVVLQTPDEADITCGWAANNAQFHLLKKTPNAQGEVSSYETFTRDGQKYIRHTSIAVSTVNPISQKPMTDNEVKDVCLHEVGHALGIVGHSPNYHDVMFFITNPGGGSSLRSLTERDINTINALYKDYPATN